MTLAVAGSAWAASVAAGRIVGSRLAGVAAGLLYGFSPYMLAQAEGHLHQVIALFPPLALLLLWELLARDRWRPLWCGVGLGALAAAQLLTGEEILFSSGVVGALALVALVPFAGRAAVRGRLPRAALGLAAAGLTFAVLGAYPLWVQFFGPERVQAAVQLPDVFVTDLLNLVLPTHHQWLAPQRVLDVVFKFTGNGSEWDGYLGVPLVAVLLGTVVWLRRQRLVLWAALMVLGVAVLSLGPHLHVGGTVTTVRLPWRLVSKLPVFESVLPGRLAVLVVLFAALVVAALVARLRTAGLPARALAGAGLALTVVTLMPAPLSMAYLNPVSPFFGGRDVEVVPAGSVALVAPFSSAPGSRPTAAAYNEATWTMLWQAESGMRFRTPSGYVRIVGPGGPQLGPPASVTQDAMLRVQDGEGLPQLTPELRARLVADLRAWRVTSVVVGQMSDQDTMVALFTWLLEREPQRHGDVYVWLDVDPSRLS